MPISRTLAAAALFLVCVGLALPTDARAQSSACSWYADTALKQQQRNEHGKCGLTGPEWHSDRQVHLAWCANHNPDKWKAEAQRREQLLNGCKK